MTDGRPAASGPTTTSIVPPSGAYLQALSTRTPMSRSTSSAEAVIETGSGATRTPSARCRVSATAANRSAACRASVPRSTGSRAGGAAEASKRASQSMSSRRRRIRLDSRSILPNALRYQAASRSWARASEVWASMTESGVRSSWLASAVNSSWRRRAASMGAATRRPTTTAPRKTKPSRNGAMMSVPTMMVCCASPTSSADWAMTRWPPTESAPATRIVVPSMVAVRGAVTACRSAGRSGVVESTVVMVPSGATSHARNGRPCGRPGSRPPAGGPPFGEPDGGPPCGRTRASVRRWSTCEVRSRVAKATTAAAMST